MDPLLPLVADEFSISPGAASATVTAFVLSYGLLQVVCGPLGDRFGRYATITAAALVSAFGSLACALSYTLDALLIARFVTGATIGAFIPLSLAWIGDTFPYERRQAVLARFLMGQMAGVAFGTALAGWLGEHFGWRAIFVTLFALLLIITALLGMELKRNPLTARAGAVPASMLQSFARMPALFARPRVRMLLITGFTEGLFVFGALAFVAYYFQQRFALGPGASGTLVAAYAGGGMIYGLAAKRAVRGLGEKGLATLGGAALALGYVVAPSALFGVLCVAAVGAGFYMFHTTVQIYVTQVSPEERGSSVALFATFLFMGQALGVWLAARVVDGVGAAPVFAASAVGLLALSLAFRRQLLRWRNEA
jgi:predicted MFS family arabinose efflux permease